MRHPRIIIASISLAAAAAIGGGVTAATATTSHASSPARCQPARRGYRPHRAGDRRRQDRDHPGQQPGPAAVLLPERHGGEVGRHRRAGGAVAAADVRVTGRHRADRHAHRGHGHPRQPGRLQRAPAVHLRRRSGRPGDRPGSAGLFRGHPRPHPDHRVRRQRRARPRPLRPATLTATETARCPGPLPPFLRAEPAARARTRQQASDRQT